MTLLVDPKTPELLVIGDRKYQMKPATVAERTRWRRAIAAGGGRQHGPAALLNCLAAGVNALMKDEAPAVREAVLQKISDQRDRVVTFYTAAKDATVGAPEANQAFLEAGRAVDEGDASLAVIIAAVSEGYPAYSQMVADEATYWPTAGLEAMRLFCVGWEGVKVDGQDVPFVRGPAGMSEECLAEVPEGDLRTIGQMFENLCRVTPQQRKNLLSLRSSSSASGTSST